MSDGRSIFHSCLRRAENYLFNYADRQAVDIHQSTLSSKALLGLRLFSFIFLTSIYIWTITIYQKSLFENIMYLTMIGYLVSWLYFALTIQDYCINFGSKPLAKKLCQYIEILHEIGFCVQLPITMVFWGFLFKIVINTEGVTTQQIIINGFLHSAPLVLLAADFILNTFSFHINHLPVVIIFGVIYLVINLTYSLEVKPIYGPIDWVSVGSYIIVASSILLTILVHFIGRVVYRKWKSPKITASGINRALLDAAPSSRESFDSVKPTRENEAFLHNSQL